MKKSLLLFVSVTCIVIACFVTSAIAQPGTATKSVSLIIPASGASNKPFQATTSVVAFGDIVSNLYPSSNMKGVNITSAKIESNDAVKQNLSLFKSLKIYISHKDGSNPILLASKPSVSKNAGTDLFFDVREESSGGSGNKLTAAQIPQNAKLEDLLSRLSGVTVVYNSLGSSVQIRGRSTTSSSAPIFDIDGVTRGSSIPQIPGNTILSIEVLKEPTEVSMYGRDGANGVIRIKTRQGEDVSAVSSNPEDSNIIVRLEYSLRDELKTPANLNITLATATK